MLEIKTTIKNIQEDIRAGYFTEAEKKISRLALFLTGQIKKKKLSGAQLDQVSDWFFILFETQLEKKIFSAEIENLLYHCFNLHTFINKKDYQKDKKFWEEVKRIENLAQGLSVVHGCKN